jgi:magnesium-transporting ATPase (P-type)
MLIRAYLILGVVQSAVTMLAFYYFYWTNGFWGKWIDLPDQGPLYRAATGIALASVVMTQIGNLFAERSETVSIFKIPFFKNRLIFIGILTELAVILLFVYAPVFNKFIGTGPFSFNYWPLLFATIPSLIITDEIRKLVLRRNQKNG